MPLRDHEPILIEEFNGLWKRGDQDSVPSDHFSDGENLQFIESGFETRAGLDTLIAKGDIVRMYNYKMQNGESLIALDGSGNIWHSLLDGSHTIYGPVLTITEMTDFGFVAYNGRAYITPYKTFTDLNGTEFQKGLENEFVYVYKGDGTAARKAAGLPPTNSDDTPMIAFNTPLIGDVVEGIRILAATFSDVSNDDSTALGPTVLPTIYAPGNQSIQLTNIPIGGAGITKRKIWSTKVIPTELWTANYADFTFYLVTTIDDNTTTSVMLSFAETDLTVPFSPGSLANPTSGGLEVRNTATEGHCTIGLHIVGVVYETDTGYLTAPGPEKFGVQTFIDDRKAIEVTNIPVSPDAFVVKRHLVSSKAIIGYNSNDHDYQMFFIPGGTIDDNTSTSIELSYFDGELLDDASHLMDNFAEIPAGVTLTQYHTRMCLSTTFTDISVFYFSAPGEPEAFDQIDGLIVYPLDGLPITNGHEYRDIFYAFKKVRTYAVADNGDVPSTWQVTIIDNGIGASIHGIAYVLDSGGVNIDYLMIVDYSGIMIFNGLYQRPELTYKILDLWTALDRNFFSAIQILNDSLTQIVYMVLPNMKILFGDYKNGFNPKDIRWMVWRFNVEVSTIALYNTNTLAIGSPGELVPPLEVLAFGPTGIDPTDDAIVTFELVFNLPVTGVDDTIFTLDQDGLGDTPDILSVTGTGDTYSISATTGSGDGDLAVVLENFANVITVQGKALTSAKTSNPHKIRRNPPIVRSINRANTSPILGGQSGSWTVIFSMPVTGVDLSDFQLVGTQLATGFSLSSIVGTGDTYIVTAGMGTGPGTVGLNLLNNGSIKNLNGVALSAGFTGQVYTVQTVPNAPINFIFTFVGSNRVSFTFTDRSTNEDDFEIQRSVNGGSFTALATILVNSYDDITVNPATNYQYRVRAVNNVGNSAYLTSQIITTANVFPTPVVNSINRSNSNPTNVSSVTWLVSFSIPVTGVSTSAFSLANVGLTSPSITSVVASGGTGTGFLVTANTGTGTGTLGLNLSNVAGIQSLDGVPLQTTFTGQVYNIDRTAPTVSSLNRALPSPTTQLTLVWTVIFAEAVTGVTVSNFVLTGVTGSVVSVSGSGTTYTITTNINPNQSGTVGLNLVP